MIDLSLKDKEKENLTEEERELAMARKLEIEMLPILRRNIKFFYAGGDLKGKANAYRTSMNKNEVEQTLKEEKTNNIATVCKPLCEMVVEILRENGLNAQTVSCDTDIFKHIDVLLTTKSGKKYIINYLEDIENIQTGMATPTFAAKAYYERRYEKFQDGTIRTDGITTDGKDIKGIDFINEERMDLIDTNLGYKKYGMYMDNVIQQLKEEFSDFKNVMAENEWFTKQLELEKDSNVTEKQKESIRNSIYNKYETMSKEDEVEAKLDWIFKYFNERMDLKGYTDFAMYYSRLLLQKVLTDEEYHLIKRYDGIVNNEKIPEDSKIKNVLDFDNQENKKNNRFAMLKVGKNAYVFSTKPNEYAKLNEEELEELGKYANLSRITHPSDLLKFLCDRGNALPLVFHPIGSQMLNERAELIDKNLTEEERAEEIKKLSESIKTTDEPVTSILIPYPNGEEKKLYINDNDEVVVRTKRGEQIYHYDEENDKFEIEDISNEER